MRKFKIVIADQVENICSYKNIQRNLKDFEKLQI
jgi:hypothetical protein